MASEDRPGAARDRAAIDDRPAAAGGTPVRAEPLPFFRPSVGSAEERAVVEVLRSGWLTTGPRTAAFEAAFAEAVGVPHAVGVSSCTAGLHLLLRALGIGPGDEVVTSPMTFPATANAVLQAGAAPVFADVLPGRLTLDPLAAKAAVTARTRALLGVHYAGWPCEMEALRRVADDAGLVLIEDAAHGLGATYAGRPVGSLGDAAAFSFYPNKNMTTAEGGMVTTARDDLAERVRLSCMHGLDLDASQRESHRYAHWESVALGWKANLNDLQAALGLVQLRRLPDLLARRRRLDARYREALADWPAVEVVGGPEVAENAAHLFPILIRPEALSLDRDGLLVALGAENIGVGVHFRALPLHAHFRRTVPTPPEAVPVALDASERLLSLPLHPALEDADQDDVLAALGRILRFYAR